MANDYYPLQLRPIAKATVWGGRNLERLLGKTLTPGALIGETWEAWDGCVIENGAHRGATLGQLIEADAPAILGSSARRLPLLFKFIDAQDDLSVQVHPNDAQAQQIENYPYGKTEAWYILHAEPGAMLIHGFKDVVDPTHVRAYLDQNRLQELLAYAPVRTGDVIFVPAGTVHAIQRGIVLAEIQENSDITYRLYDWGRADKTRRLHVDESLQVSTFAPSLSHTIPSLTIHHSGYDQHFLVACQYFVFERLDVHATIRISSPQHRFQILSIVQGAARINEVDAPLGQTLLIPAQCDTFEIVPIAPCQILRAYIPDLRHDLIEPLQRAGYRPSEIARLGGDLSATNALLPWL